MQFVVDQFHTLPRLTVSVFLVVGQKGQFLNPCSFLPLAPAINSRGFYSWWDVRTLPSLCLLRWVFFLRMEVNDCPVLQDFKECSAFQE